MAASLLLMVSDKNKAMKPAPALCASSEEEPPKMEPSRSSRGRKANHNGKGPNQKKVPQRGMGVAQLESILRVQEMNQMQRSSSSTPVITPLLSPFAGNQLPLHHAASTNHGPLHHCPPPPLIFNGNAVIPGGSGQGPTVAHNAGFNNVLGVGGGGYSYGFGAPAWSNNPLVGCPLETSRELSSMPNPHSQSQPCDLCFNKKRFPDDNIQRGSNTRRDSALEIWSMINNGPDHHFLGLFSPQQQAPNQLPAEITDFTTTMSTPNAYFNSNLDESVGVVAVHRKVGSMSGKILMEYEFFPGKENASGTTSKELELSLVGGDQAASSSSITAALLSARARNADATSVAASNSVDLSLKL